MRPFIALLLFGAAAAVQAQQRTLDDFESLSPWQAQASDGVSAAARNEPGMNGQALQLDFDFHGKGGYAFVRRNLPLDLPQNYEISFRVRADALPNHFEFKLTDASGDNVWWYQQQDYKFPSEWTTVRFKKRQVAFAWGPSKDKTLRHADRIEFVVSAGKGGGKGSVLIDDLMIRALPPVPAQWPQPVAKAGSGGAPSLALDGRRDTAWEAPPGTQSFTVDLGAQREFGGLVLRWLPGRHASRYEVALSDDGSQWRTVRKVEQGNGGDDAMLLTESEARYIRLTLLDGPGGYGLAELELKDLAFGATPNSFIEALAADAPRGQFPRGFSGQQPYWTLVGVDGGAAHSALISEDGAVESMRGGFSIEPFVQDGGKLLGWADVQVSQSLQEGYLPLPSVLWRANGWTLTTTSFAEGSREQSQLLTRYTLRNLTDQPKALELVLAARPFQVNAPKQFLNTPGGFSAIRELEWDGKALSVNGRRSIYAVQAPDRVQLSAFDAGLLPHAGAGTAMQVSDSTGFASAALRYRVELPPQGSAEIALAAPLSGAPSLPAAAELAARQEQVAAQWRERLNQVEVQVPAQGRLMADTMRSSLAHMLMSRDAAALQPGTRSYLRSWIRDGAMMSEALLRLGQPEIAAEYLRWYAPFQFANGKVPCCVDRRGADPVPENDSHGQLIFLAAEQFRYTRDRAALEAAWPHVQAAAAYMEQLRQSERTVQNRAPERRALYGLMPASISHEGYSEKPMHSYWDDFWALRGYKDAVFIARALGRHGDAARLARQRDEFRKDLYDSFAHATRLHGISYLPGAAELGDFDPTSTTIGLTPGGEQQQLPRGLLLGTYDKYWEFFTARRDGSKAWEDYTPYELRNVSAFVRLGWRERAEELLDYFYADQRPHGWNQWAEVVGREMRKPRFLGDMPHGWISSDFLRAALDSFAYEREPEHALLLAEGIPLRWLDGLGIGIRQLRTPYGPLSYSLRHSDGKLRLQVEAGTAIPPGGIVLRWPWPGEPGAARLNGKPVKWSKRQFTIRSLPAVLETDMGDQR